MQHIVDRNSWQWQDAKPATALTWTLWGCCALFCLSAAVNTGISGLTFGLPFAGIITSMVLRGYARPASFGLFFICAILKFAQDDTSTLYYNGIGEEVLVSASEFCPNYGGKRPYLARRCEAPISTRFKRTLGTLPPGEYTVSEVVADYDELNTRYTYVVDTPLGPASVSPQHTGVTWADGGAIDESLILKDVPRWLSMFMYYPKIPLLLFRNQD